MSWKSYENAVEKGPGALLFKAFGLILAVLIVLGITGYIFGLFGEAAQVAQEELGPKAALAKYEWFIEQANGIEKMDKDITMFEDRTKQIDEQYKSYGDDKAKWPAHIQVQYNKEKQQGREDLIAIASQRNNLVKEYHSASDKFNWKPFQTRPDKPKERFNDYVVK